MTSHFNVKGLRVKISFFSSIQAYLFLTFLSLTGLARTAQEIPVESGNLLMLATQAEKAIAAEKKILHQLITLDILEKIESHFKQKNIIQCPFCPQSFSGYTALEEHFQEEGLLKRYYCEKCNYRGEKHYLLFRHRGTLSHQTASSSPAVSQTQTSAPIAVFPTLSRKHELLDSTNTAFIQKYLSEKESQPSSTAPIKCPFCDFCGRSLAQLEVHLSKELNRGGKLYTCTDCRKDFTSYHTLNAHIAGGHSDMTAKRPRVDKFPHPAPTREGDDAV